MKLLVINPNISKDVTALIESEALHSAAPGTVEGMVLGYAAKLATELDPQGPST